MSQITLNPLSKDNDEQLEQFVMAVQSSYTACPFPPTTQTLKSDQNKYFLAYDTENGRKELVGTTGYQQKTQFLAETIKTVVLEKHQGKGLGKAISILMEDHLRELGFKKIVSTIYDFNYQMIMIKLKLGYKIEGYHPNHEKPGLNEYSLGKEI